MSQVQCRRAFEFETQAVEFSKGKVVVGRKNRDHCVSNFFTPHDGTGLFEGNEIACFITRASIYSPESLFATQRGIQQCHDPAGCTVKKKEYGCDFIRVYQLI